jgi:type I restriction-modification system DNA methylase subunit
MIGENGTCLGVLKEGVFFDEKYSDIRKAIIENFNVTNLISIPQDAFENTSTKTSMIIFHNDGNKTSQIEFSEMIIEKEEEDIFEFNKDGYKLVKSKDEIKTDENGEWLGFGVWERQLCIGTYDEISKPKIKGEKEKYVYSLNYKDYKGKDEITYCPEGYELKRLGDICEIKYGSRITKSKDGIEKSILENVLFVPLKPGII